MNTMRTRKSETPVAMMTRNGDDSIWQAAHEALFTGNWTAARGALEDLLRNTSRATDELLTLKEAMRASGRDCPDFYRAVLADRIDLWNAACRRRLGL